MGLIRALVLLCALAAPLPPALADAPQAEQAELPEHPRVLTSPAGAWLLEPALASPVASLPPRYRKLVLDYYGKRVLVSWSDRRRRTWRVVHSQVDGAYELWSTHGEQTWCARATPIAGRPLVPAHFRCPKFPHRASWLARARDLSHLALNWLAPTR